MIEGMTDFFIEIRPAAVEELRKVIRNLGVAIDWVQDTWAGIDRRGRGVYSDVDQQVSVTRAVA